jgi:C1A family cysteine protease
MKTMPAKHYGWIPDLPEIPSTYKGKSMRTNKRFGWIPDLPDQRDKMYNPGVEKLARAAADLPPSVSLSSKCGPVLDQGQLGSCTANATSGAITFIEPGFLGSRLFMYYNGRVVEGTPLEDSGCQLRDVVKQVNALGVCSEAYWSYNPNCFAIKPGPNRYATARKDLLLQYLSIQQDLDHMRASLAAGFPFIYGFTVYESFESDAVANSGIVPMPGQDEPVVGGHAVMCIGYDDSASTFLCRNSWGSGWGLPGELTGNFTIPYDYLSDSNLAADFWTLRKMEV